MTSWKQWEAERDAKLAERRSMPSYGGNKIPAGYLRAHNEKVGRSIAKRLGFEYVDEREISNTVPKHIEDFTRLI